jgi:hypothetical protein
MVLKFHNRIIPIIPSRKQVETDDSLVIQRHSRPHREFTLARSVPDWPSSAMAPQARHGSGDQPRSVAELIADEMEKFRAEGELPGDITLKVRRAVNRASGGENRC